MKRAAHLAACASLALLETVLAAVFFLSSIGCVRRARRPAGVSGSP